MEQMQKGVSTFDLRDDEWMMVEDELLETAKLFTRHLHIAEYERLKEKIEAKKKEAETARPVIAGARMSDDGALRMKAKDQERKQKNAIRDLFASQDDETAVQSALPYTNVSKSSSTPNASSRIANSTSRPAAFSSTANNSDSEDLDALRPANIKTNPVTKSMTEVPARKSPSSNHPDTGKTYSTFTKPAPPLAVTKVRSSKMSRLTPFDMLDDYKQGKALSTNRGAESQWSRITVSPKPRVLSLSPTKTSANSSPIFEHGKSKRSSGSLDDWGSSGVSKDTADRLAKRRADRDKEEKERHGANRKAVRSDEIPTFLF